MEQVGNVDPNQFVHIRMVLSMVVSLAIARLLSGLAKFAQHPGRAKAYAIHLLWAIYMLVMLIHFWWWEFALNRVPLWHFGIFAFVVGYGAVLYLLCAILFPDDITEYDGYRGYFLSRRSWFFGILGFAILLDVIDTWIKGDQYLISHGVEYGVRTIAGVGLCAIAAYVEDERFHVVFVIACLIYQASWIFRLYEVLA